MRSLLWKDAYLARYVFVLAVILLCVPYSLCLVRRTGSYEATFVEVLIASCRLSMALSLVTTIIVGGNAVAAERLDNCDIFLAYLPPTRGQVLASKSIVCCVTIAAVWLVNLVVYFVANRWPSRETDAGIGMVPLIASSAVLTFGASWLVSCVSKSAVPAIVAGIMSVPLVWLVSFWLVSIFSDRDRGTVELFYVVAAPVIGACGIVGGWLLFLNPWVAERVTCR